MNQLFPRATLVLEAEAIADLLRRKAAEIETLANEADTLEIGTAWRKLRSVSLEVAFSLGGDES